jgi:hypothetical protein
LKIEICDFFVIWCLLFGIYQILYNVLNVSIPSCYREAITLRP